jgi:hypothetical protein
MQSLTNAILDKKKEMNIALVKGESSEDKEAPKRKKKMHFEPKEQKGGEE